MIDMKDTQSEQIQAVPVDPCGINPETYGCVDESGGWS